MPSWRLSAKAVVAATALAVVGTLGFAQPSVTTGPPDVVVKEAAPEAEAPKVTEVTVPDAEQAGEPEKDLPEAPSDDDAEVIAALPETPTKSFGMVGVTWNGVSAPEGLDIKVRTKSSEGWQEWQDLSVEETPAEGGRGGTEPLWVGESDGMAVNVTSTTGEEPEDLKIVTVDPGSTTAPETAVSPAIFKTDTPTTSAMATAAASPSKPAIISRSAWGASSGSYCSSPTDGGTTQGAVIHHTAGSNSYTKSGSAAVVRAAQSYHIKGQKWCDIGYNFLVDKYGQIFEGRKGGVDKTIRGAHAGNFDVNLKTMGVSLMGNYDTAQPSSEIKTAVVNLVAWRFGASRLKAKGTYGVGGVTLNRIAGHRNVKSTACPGKYVYSWLSASGGLRDRVEDKLSGTPAAPSGLKSSAQTKDTLSLSWNAASGAKRYRIQYSKSSNMSGASYKSFTTNKATLTGLSASTKYYFRVVVVDADDEDKLSDYTPSPYPNAVTKPAWWLSTPSGLKSSAQSGNSLSLTWDAVSGAKRYRIQYSKSSSMSGASYKSFTTNKATLTGLSSGTKYYFRVVVVDADDKDKLSNYTANPWPSATTMTAGRFSTPSALTSSEQGDDSLSLTWTAVSGAPRYRVQYSKSSTMSGASYKSFTTNAATLTGLSSGTKYYFRVVVVDADDKDKLSNYTADPWPSAATKTAGWVTTPTELRSSAQSGSSLTLSWKAVQGAPRYRIQYSKSSTMSGASYKSFTTNSATLTGLAANTKYYFRVVVVDADDKDKLSEYTPATYPSASTMRAGWFSTPSGLKSSGQAKSSMSLTWNAVNGAPRYRIQYSKSSNMSGASYKSFTTSSATLTGLAANTRYYFRVVVVDAEDVDKLSEYTPIPFPNAVTTTS